jgi:hypothetical protein
VPVRGQPRNPFGQRPTRFHRLRVLGGDVESVDTIGETPDRFHERTRVFLQRPGESPAVMETDTRALSEAPGTIRRLWRQNLAPVGAPPPFVVSARPAVAQRQVRFKAGTRYKASGTLNSRFSELHTTIRQAIREPTPRLSTGVRRGMPTVRNRLTSFGSRVDPLNPRVAAASDQ